MHSNWWSNHVDVVGVVATRKWMTEIEAGETTTKWSLMARENHSHMTKKQTTTTTTRRLMTMKMMWTKVDFHYSPTDIAYIQHQTRLGTSKLTMQQSIAEQPIMH